MFLVLTRVLLWLLVLIIFFYVFFRIVPKAYFTFLGGLLLAVFVILLFVDPTDRTATTAWGILSLPFKPLGIVWLLLAQALRGFKSGVISKAAQNEIRSAFILLWLFSTPFLWQWIYHNSVERQVSVLARITQGQTAETLVLLAHDTTEPQVEGRSQLQLGDRGNLILYANQLYQAGGITRIIVSGGNPLRFPPPDPDSDDPARSTNEAELAAELLRRLGIPSTSILVDNTSPNLRQSVLGVRELLAENNIDSPIILVSRALSMYRSASSFVQGGMAVIPRPTDYVAFVDPDQTQDPVFTLEAMMPSYQGLTLATQLTDEYLLTIYYFLRGWLSPTELTCLECQLAASRPEFTFSEPLLATDAFPQ
ncbi:MAG: YdcF family protein [Ectothiorhodospiraceae bacterium]|nr:YdcF family protein [Ectothiorhodospiraceae bacterium]